MTTTTTFNPALVGGVHLPALKGRQGDRDMYLVLVQNTMLLRNFAAEAEPMDDADHKSQRSLDPKHANDIVVYITENSSDYVLGAVTYSVDTVDPDMHFQPSYEGSNVGFLVLPLDAELRCLDGQHRRRAIKEASDDDPGILHDYTAVVLYVEDDYVKRRQMFSDMNSTPKVVAKALNVGFDTRDPYAQAAQHLADNHPLLEGVVEKEKARITARSANIFSLAGVYDGLKRYVLGKSLPRGRSPRDREVSELIEFGTELFDTLSAARPEFGRVREEALTIEDPRERGAFMSRERKATLLLSTTTLRVIAGALHQAMDEDDEIDPGRYIKRLSTIDFTPQSHLFNKEGVEFVGRGGTPSARNQEVMAATAALAEALRLKG